jgi:hypothetical protein
MQGNVAKALSGNNALKVNVIETATNVVSGQEILPAAADYSYAVFHVAYSASAAGSATLNSGSTAIYAPLTLAGAGTVAVGNPESNQPLCKTAIGASLTLTTTGTASHVVAIIYAKIPR